MDSINFAMTLNRAENALLEVCTSAWQLQQKNWLHQQNAVPRAHSPSAVARLQTFKIEPFRHPITMDPNYAGGKLRVAQLWDGTCILQHGMCQQ